MQIQRKTYFWLTWLVLPLFLIYATSVLIINNSGKLLVGFIEDQAVPYVLKTDDVALGCVMAEGKLTPHLIS
jgi:hypothetical protein